MKIALAIAVLASGCRGILGIDDPALGTGDGGASSSDADAMPCVGTFAPICLTDPIPKTLDYIADTVLDTCDDVRLVAGVELCVIAAEHIRVSFGASVATAPVTPVFVFVATSDIEIAGTLDQWSAGRDANCVSDEVATSNGGAGGSFGTLGGAGGQRAPFGTSTQPGAIATPTTIRMGCPGGEGGNSGGAGGAAGGPIVLMAPSIHLASTARINASGGGGGGASVDLRGGGGGGSGGLIVFDSTMLAIDVGAVVVALGGGGGEGASGFAGNSGSRGIAIDPVAPAAGGKDGSGPAGDGGAGGTTAAGTAGQNAGGADYNGGGGGGGGAGVIYVTSSSPTISGTVVPAATPPR